MKNFFKKMKSYSFWVSFSSALIILLNALGKAFGFKIENQIVEDCVMSIAGLLVVFGIVGMNGKNNNENSDDEVSDDKEVDVDEKNDNENNE